MGRTCPYYHMANKWLDQIYPAHAVGACSLTTPATRTSSTVLPKGGMGPAFLNTSAGASSPIMPRQVSGANSTQPSDTNLAPGNIPDKRYLPVLRDLHMTLGGSTCQDFIVVLEFAGYSHQVIPHNPRVPILPLFIVHTPCISFSSISPHLLAHLCGAWCIWVSGIVSVVLYPAHVMALGKSHLKLCSLPGTSGARQAGSHLRHGLLIQATWHQAGVISGVVSLPMICKAVISLLFYASNISMCFRRSI